MAAQEFLNLPDRAVPQRVRRQPHVGSIQIPFRFRTGAVDSDDRYRRANDDNEEEEEDEGTERGEGGLVATPTPRLAGGANRPGVNGLALEETAQVVGEFYRGRVAAVRFFLEAFQADGLQIARDTWIKQPR